MDILMSMSTMSMETGRKKRTLGALIIMSMNMMKMVI